MIQRGHDKYIKRVKFEAFMAILKQMTAYKSSQCINNNFPRHFCNFFFIIAHFNPNNRKYFIFKVCTLFNKFKINIISPERQGKKVTALLVLHYQRKHSPL